MGTDQKAAVKAGIFVVLAGMLLVIVIIFLGQRSKFLTRTYPLWARFANAYGLIPGADVRLAGVTAGSVRSVRVLTDENGKSHVNVVLDVIYDYKPIVTADSCASIRTLGPLGDKYVEISLGSPDSAEMQRGQRIPSEDGEDFYDLSNKLGNRLDEVGQTLGQVNKALDSFNETGAVNKLNTALDQANKALEDFNRLGAIKKLSTTLERTDRIAQQVSTIIETFNKARIIEQFTEGVASLQKSIKTTEEGPGLLHDLIYDQKMPAILTNVKEASASAKDILSNVKEGKGAAHALVYGTREREIINDLGAAARSLNRILADVRTGRGTLGLLIADPELWEMLKRVLGGIEESRTLKYLIRQQADGN